jgi:DNA-binding transcriptional regulator YiaG
MISASQIVKMYHPLHEADIQKFVNVMDKLFDKYNPPTHLQQIRKLQGLSQSQLAFKSGVSKRVIQAYEQREKILIKQMLQM